MSKPRNKKPISRRQFIEGTGAAIVAAAAVPALQAQSASAKADGSAPNLATIHVTVNGAPHAVEVDDRWTLAEVLRDHLGLTGTKLGCDRGECGACTVHIDGKATRSCVTPISAVAGKSITTIEGLAGEAGKAVQTAWVSLDVPQCGYCQSGQIMSASALLAGNAKPTDADIDAAMAGNICRCATYARIRAAIHQAADSLPASQAKS